MLASKCSDCTIRCEDCVAISALERVFYHSNNNSSMKKGITEVLNMGIGETFVKAQGLVHSRFGDRKALARKEFMEIVFDAIRLAPPRKLALTNEGPLVSAVTGMAIIKCIKTILVRYDTVDSTELKEALCEMAFKLTYYPEEFQKMTSKYDPGGAKVLPLCSWTAQSIKFQFHKFLSERHLLQVPKDYYKARPRKNDPLEDLIEQNRWEKSRVHISPITPVSENLNETHDSNETHDKELVSSYAPTDQFVEAEFWSQFLRRWNRVKKRQQLLTLRLVKAPINQRLESRQNEMILDKIIVSDFILGMEPTLTDKSESGPIRGRMARAADYDNGTLWIKRRILRMIEHSREQCPKFERSLQRLVGAIKTLESSFEQSGLDPKLIDKNIWRTRILYLVELNTMKNLAL